MIPWNKPVFVRQQPPLQAGEPLPVRGNLGLFAEDRNQPSHKASV